MDLRARALTRYDAILLDVGSTLLEFDPVQRIRAFAEIIGASFDATEAAWRTARAGARPLSGRETRDEFDAFRTEVCAQVLGAAGYEGVRAAAISAMSDAWVRVGWAPFPDVRPALTKLHAAGYRLGVVSNWTPTLELTLSHLELTEHFDVVACSSVVGAIKPDVLIFEHALDALGVEPAQALYVGDHYEADVVGARDAGMDAVLIVRGESADAVADTTVTTVRSLDELCVLLDA